MCIGTSQQGADHVSVKNVKTGVIPDSGIVGDRDE